MIDISNPWLLLVGILLGSPVFLALLNWWLSRSDKVRTHEDAFRRDLLTRNTDLEHQIEALVKSRDDYREKWFLAMEEANNRKFDKIQQGLSDD